MCAAAMLSALHSFSAASLTGGMGATGESISTIAEDGGTASGRAASVLTLLERCILLAMLGVAQQEPHFSHRRHPHQAPG